MKSKSESGFKLPEYAAHLLCSLLYRVELLLADLPGPHHLIDDRSGILPAILIHEVCEILHQRITAVLPFHLVKKIIRHDVPPFLPSVS